MSRQHLLLVSIGWLLLSGCKPRPDKIRVESTTIDYVMVYNRGNYSTYDRRRITSRDTINRICKLLNQANWVSLETIDKKQSWRFARFDFHDARGERTAEFSYNITKEDGNIVWYWGSNFRSDSLDLYLK